MRHIANAALLRGILLVCLGVAVPGCWEDQSIDIRPRDSTAAAGTGAAAGASSEATGPMGGSGGSGGGGAGGGSGSIAAPEDGLMQETCTPIFLEAAVSDAGADAGDAGSAIGNGPLSFA